MACLLNHLLQLSPQSPEPTEYIYNSYTITCELDQTDRDKLGLYSHLSTEILLVQKYYSEFGLEIGYNDRCSQRLFEKVLILTRIRKKSTE